MTFSYIDILITLVIVAAVLFAAHRLGQANPVGTGRLSRRLTEVEAKVSEQGNKLDRLEGVVATLADSTADISRELSAVRMELAGDRGLAERTWSAIDRIQNYFIEDAFRKRTGQ